MRLVLALLLSVLALPAQAQERFFQACVASAAGEEMPPGMDPGAMCGCATQQAIRAGALAADLDRLADHVPAGGDGGFDMASLPDDLRPAAEAGVQALMGCALQLGMAEMLTSGAEAVAEAMAAVAAPAVAPVQAVAPAPAVAPIQAAPPAAPVQAAPAPMRNGIPPQLAARMAAPAPAPNAVTAEVMLPGGPISGSATLTVTPPVVSPDGTVATAPTARTARGAVAGIRTGAGAPVVRATQSSKGAAIRILQ